MEKRSLNIGSLLKGVLIGGAIASVVVLLNAPHSGSDTRHLIQEKAKELRERSMKTVQDARQRVDQKFSEALDYSDQVVKSIAKEAEITAPQEPA